MRSLVQNENMKIYRRVRTWVMVGLILLAVFVQAFVTYTMSKDTQNPNWKADMTKQTEYLESQMSTGQLGAPEKAQARAQILDNQYRIEHNLPEWEKTAYSFTQDASSEIILVILFTLIIAGDIMASEHSWGTIKLLLIRPVKRWKILLAKLLATLGFGLGCTLLVMLWSFVLGGLFFGFSGADQPNFITTIDGDLLQIHMGAFVWLSFGFKFVTLVMMAMFAFMLSTIFQSSALAITLSMLAMLFGETICRALNQFAWVKYMLFANLDLSQYISGETVVPGTTPWFSVIILVVYFALFYWLSWLSFTKRDVKV